MREPAPADFFYVGNGAVGRSQTYAVFIEFKGGTVIIVIGVRDIIEQPPFLRDRKGCLISAVAELVGIEVGVVSGVINLESSGVEASDWRPRHDEHYHEV